MAVDLSALIPAPKKVNLGQGEAAVYGLNLSQLAVLLKDHAQEVQSFLGAGEPDMTTLVMVLPEVAVKLIAMGLRAEGQEEMVKQLPVALQIDILLDIWELSVPDAKKLKARLSEFSDVLTSLAQKQEAKSLSLSQNPSPSA